MRVNRLDLPQLATTVSFAELLAPQLRRGDCLALNGPLGAGKTAFARALLKSLGVQDDVPSPTFTLVQTYNTPQFPIYHFDLYRLKSSNELDELGWEDALSEGLVIVEWAHHAENRLPADALSLTFEVGERGTRQCEISLPNRWDTRLGDFRL